MLGTCVLREAGKSSGNVKTLADYTEAQPLTFQCSYFILRLFDGSECVRWNTLAILVYHAQSGL